MPLKSAPSGGGTGGKKQYDKPIGPKPSDADTTTPTDEPPKDTGNGPMPPRPNVDGNHPRQDTSTIPGLYKSLYGRPMPDGFIRKAHEAGMSDEQIRAYLLDHAHNYGAPGNHDTTQSGSGALGSAIAAYRKIWGTDPPPGYIERLIQAGMNTTEIINYERSKGSYGTGTSALDYQTLLEQLAPVMAKALGNEGF